MEASYIFGLIVGTLLLFSAITIGALKIVKPKTKSSYSNTVWLVNLAAAFALYWSSLSFLGIISLGVAVGAIMYFLFRKQVPAIEG